ncbi:C-type lectin mannose-binding isoform-like [Penaeus indicus]|uniref:C-type lectin mannose-binding isoform-like n=1 Tax=Penaeus indicus TaxID=29960 RepID=UPI00300D6374
MTERHTEEFSVLQTLVMNKYSVFAAVVAVSLAKPITWKDDSHSAKSCPIPYRPVADRCLMFDTFHKVTWHDARDFCHGYLSELAQIDSADLLKAVVDFIHDEGMAGHDFWIGANDEEQEGVWKWPDGSDVHMGTPFWGYWTSPSRQEPSGGTTSNYCCMVSEYFYYFFDCWGTDKRSPLCEYRQQ